MPTRHDRRSALKRLAGASLGLSLAPLFGGGLRAAMRGSAARRPNIIFMMTDDQAFGAMSLYGNRILQTPNMDRIGREGVRFGQAFVTNSLCLPSRASYLTGQYSHTHGMLTNGEESGFNDQPAIRNEDTWPILLGKAGYHTGMVGKWHVNSPPQGYDLTAILQGQGVYFDPPMLVNGRLQAQRGHADDVIGDHALRFLQQVPDDRPFCLLCQFKAPHRGWEPAPRFAKRFENVDIPLPAHFDESLATRPLAVQKSQMRIADMPDFHDRGVPASLPEAEQARANYQAFIRHYYRVLLGVDENVGRVLDYLDRQGLADNTLIVYTSDNGFFLGEHGLFDKRLMYEPSIRVPMLLRWPAQVDAGQVDDDNFVLNIDVAPTLLDLAGADVPDNMQGRSWRPLLGLGGGSVPWRQDFLYEYFEFPAAHCVRRHRGVRNHRWKLIQFFDDPQEWELYDLQDDPDEMRNLAGDLAHAVTLRKLRQRLAQLRREYDDHLDLPVPDPKQCPA
ncbi:sulfatase [Pseudoxanthomonas kalamensis DSM 18571]|uniref:sulfatase family protein n=1 Tax=Pseudoxanthomonas kalamensis TaxID=289483 RepID=UPI0013909A19|nr:sulfatase [Pseudoxanthomonas kalamensis]KAF1711270.1 sulfatase [Pseudoxanthomonas kalamensis DSM 18571]